MCSGVLEIRWYAQLGIPAFAYGAGRLDVSHGPDEFIDEAAMRRGLRALRWRDPLQLGDATVFLGGNSRSLAVVHPGAGGRLVHVARHPATTDSQRRG